MFTENDIDFKPKFSTTQYLSSVVSSRTYGELWIVISILWSRSSPSSGVSRLASRSSVCGTGHGANWIKQEEGANQGVGVNQVSTDTCLFSLTVHSVYILDLYSHIYPNWPMISSFSRGNFNPFQSVCSLTSVYIFLALGLSPLLQLFSTFLLLENLVKCLHFPGVLFVPHQHPLATTCSTDKDPLFQNNKKDATLTVLTNYFNVGQREAWRWLLVSD